VGCGVGFGCTPPAEDGGKMVDSGVASGVDSGVGLDDGCGNAVVGSDVGFRVGPILGETLVDEEGPGVMESGVEMGTNIGIGDGRGAPTFPSVHGSDKVILEDIGLSFDMIRNQLVPSMLLDPPSGNKVTFIGNQ